MENSFDISIVIVNYNVKDFLLNCLKSIETCNTNLRVETIVVDNNSPDKSVDFLEPQFPNVRFIQMEENIGFGKANNVGFDVSRGKYVLILNPDTILRADTLDVMYDYMERNSNCGIAGCKVLNPDGSFQIACRRGFPTPWAAFSKLFGLQSIFPKFKIFSHYNQLYKSIDETYKVDAVIGAFMFARRDLLMEIGGFDPKFFMYGEDLDLCRQVKLRGFDVMYVHNTSIIHYKGESTKRSSINDIKHFYEAMEIFAEKHFGKSSLFLLLLKLGIFFRSKLALVLRFKRDFALMFLDTLSINIALMIGTKIRFEEFLGFPTYAYPTVFIVVSLVHLLSMFSVGEYFEGKHSIRRAFVASMFSFFVLSSLTYFFPEYRFSRGVVLMSIGLSVVFQALVRTLVILFDRTAGKYREKRTIVIGDGPIAEKIINSINKIEQSNLNLLGYISVNRSESFNLTKFLGNISYSRHIFKQYRPNEVVFADEFVSPTDIINIMLENSDLGIKFHQTSEYDNLVAAQIVNDISGIEPTLPRYNLSIPRYKVLKRVEDISIAIFMLSIGTTLRLIPKIRKIEFSQLLEVLTGKKSFVGIYYSIAQSDLMSFAKHGIIGPAATLDVNNLSDDSVNKLNDYYVRHYNMSFDFDIIIKYLIRK